MIQPINRTVANDYRQALGVADAPQMINTEIPITPVLLVNNSFPKPSTSQKLRYASLGITGAHASYQIATATSTKNIYFLSVSVISGAAVATAPSIFDGTSGNSPALGTGSVLSDENGRLIDLSTPATAGTTDEYIFPLPVKVKSGIRLTVGGVGQVGNVFVSYIEETIN